MTLRQVYWGSPAVYVSADCPPNSSDRKGKIKLSTTQEITIQFFRTKSKSKLMFPLCSACAITRNQGNCTHPDEERCILETWVVDGIRKAVEMCYCSVDAFRFWEYSVTCYDKSTHTGGLFAEYVDMFLKLKQESSGYPSWVQSEEDKDRYIQVYRHVEEIPLDTASLSKSGGKRIL